MRLAALATVAVLLVAGCGEPKDEASPSTAVDGAAALDFVKAFALRSDGAPRFRIPGTEGQAEGAAYLWQATDVAGWERTWQNLTGADYLALDRTAVRSYTQPGPGNDPPGGGAPRGCTTTEGAALGTLPFHNLAAVRRASDPDAPLLLLGAHWDSQMHSDFDPDPAKRDHPDPGANDGASGVGLLLQLMRELDAQAPDLPFAVGMLFIDGEDGFFDCYPLVGSLYFAQHEPRPFDVAAFVLLDMVGDPGAIYPTEGHSRDSAAGLQELLWRHGQARAPEHFVNRTATIQDDHLAFANAGIPSVDIIDGGRRGTFPPQWDTTGDTVDKLDAAMLGLVGDVLLASILDDEMAALLRA